MWILFSLFLLVIFAVVVAFTFSEGLWSNAIRLINVVTAALLAWNFWEPLARWIEDWGEFFASITYFLDFILLWVLFAVFLLVFRAATNWASQVKVKFLAIVDKIGGLVLAMAVGWVVVCFTTAAMHTAPMAVKAFGGGFDPNEKMFFGMVSPDYMWLGFAQQASQGAFSRAMSDEDARSGAYGAPNPQEPQRAAGLAVFDRSRMFPRVYADRRGEFEQLADSGSVRPSGKVRQR